MSESVPHPMTSRERVYRCLEFARPDRVPRDLWLLPIATVGHGPAAVPHEATFPASHDGAKEPLV
jgi:hypothetical protein